MIKYYFYWPTSYDWWPTTLMLREMLCAVGPDVVGHSIVVSTVTLEIAGNQKNGGGTGPTLVREQVLVLVVKVKVLQVWEAEQAIPHSLTSSTIRSDHTRLSRVLVGISWAM